MKKKNEYLYAAAILMILIGCAASQAVNIPELNGKSIKIIKEVKGNKTTLHFMDTQTGQEVYTKDIIPTVNDKAKSTITTNQTPSTNKSYALYIAFGIVILILIAIAWKISKDKDKGEKK